MEFVFAGWMKVIHTETQRHPNQKYIRTSCSFFNRPETCVLEKTMLN
jgi:hypothetical protein